VTGEREPAAMVRALSRRERACTVVTAGEQGCWYAEGSAEVSHCPALKVAAVDTTGCGDVFHGAYAAWIARGESVPAAVTAATTTAGFKATQPGGRTGIPARAVIEMYLAERRDRA
jgi:ribokinase